MNDALQYQGSGVGQAMSLGEYQPPSYAKRVEAALKDNADRGEVLKRMQEIFTAHPELEELLTLIQKVHI